MNNKTTSSIFISIVIDEQIFYCNPDVSLDDTKFKIENIYLRLLDLEIFNIEKHANNCLLFNINHIDEKYHYSGLDSSRLFLQ
ncbi:MAG: hypothetical protein HRT87_07440 [Legionellales bacterium]|nr:hypothetical protein [Legionellales bacterium]